MKSVGLNVASDSFYSLGYTGVNAGLVCLIADDPHAHSSQSEQDGRYFSQTGHVPMLEPSTPQEAYEMTKYSFDLSEKFRILTLIRTTTRVNHQSAPVEIGEVKRTKFERKNWGDTDSKYYTLSETARRLKGEAINKIAEIQKEFEKSIFNNTIEGEDDIGIVTNGISYLHVLESVDLLERKPHILKIGTLYPLPEKLIGKFLSKIKRVVVVEELLPYLEDQIKAIAKEYNPSIQIIGKHSGHFSYVGEYNVPLVVDVLAKLYSTEPPVDYESILSKAEKIKSIIPDRKPTFCPGCPHRGTMWSVQQALRGTNYVVNNDIGCYSMLLLEPYSMTDSLLDMGASQGISGGMQHVLNDKVISFLGDSTFFHAAIPGLVNAVHNKHNYTVIILDNSVTAMTGQQPNPGSNFGPEEVIEIDIESVVRGIGVKNIIVIDAFNPKSNVEIIKESIEKEGVKVIISNGPCALWNDRNKRRNKVPIVPNKVDSETCKTIYACIRDFYCPAIQLDEDTKQSTIQQDLCNGCMNCSKLCPVTAIQTTGGD
jgi:indolepyruvate ferredoxin oxidoreductase alpha subunit